MLKPEGSDPPGGFGKRYDRILSSSSAQRRLCTESGPGRDCFLRFKRYYRKCQFPFRCSSAFAGTYSKWGSQRDPHRLYVCRDRPPLFPQAFWSGPWNFGPTAAGPGILRLEEPRWIWRLLQPPLPIPWEISAANTVLLPAAVWAMLLRCLAGQEGDRRNGLFAALSSQGMVDSRDLCGLCGAGGKNRRC